jgi:hypothetical protein
MAISREQVEKLRALLKAAPETPAGTADTTKQQAVRLLAGEIQTLQRRGYTLEQVAEMLKGGGLVLTTATLKSYLSRAKAAKAARKARQAEGRAGAKAPGRARTAFAEDAPPAVPGEKAAMAAAASAPKPLTRPLGAADAVVNARTARSDTSDGPPLRSGKDAFLIKDKDTY